GDVSSSKRDTDAIAGSASPRNPNVPTPIRSAASRILLVAWRDSASSASARLIPAPSSLTRIRLFPPSSISTRIVRAPASSAFSTSPLTTAPGEPSRHEAQRREPDDRAAPRARDHGAPQGQPQGGGRERPLRRRRDAGREERIARRVGGGEQLVGAQHQPIPGRQPPGPRPRRERLAVRTGA